MESYAQLQERHRKAFNDFVAKHGFFAYSEKQFTEGMQKLGLDPEADKEKVTSAWGGLICLKTHFDELLSIGENNSKEHIKAIEADTTGEEYCYKMFMKELPNHEYDYTREALESLEACGLDFDDLNKYPQLASALARACFEIAHAPAEWGPDGLELQNGDGLPNDVDLTGVLYSRIGNLGHISQTRAVAETAEHNPSFKAEVMEALRAYVWGQWGELPQEDIESNNAAIGTQDGYLGKYKTSQGEIYIDTPAGREYTMIMFTNEY